MLDEPRQSAVGVEALHQRALIAQQFERGQDRNFVPDLTIGRSLVETRDQRRARINQSLPHATAKTLHIRGIGRLQQIKRMTRVEQPDRLEIRAEERTRGPKHVVAIRPRQIPLGQRRENPCAERSVRRIASQEVERRTMHSTFDGPQLRAHGPPVVVLATDVVATALFAAMRVRRPRIKLEIRAVSRTPTATSGESGLLLGNRQRSFQQKTKIVG